jgi:glucose/arabinose dehydrogenase
MRVLFASACAIPMAVVGCGGGNGDRFDAAAPMCTPNPGTNVRTVEVASVDDVPTIATAPRGDRRLFIAERSGAIKILEDGTVRGTPFIDLDDGAGGPVAADGEMGLLGLAFHPDYQDNRKFYVFYTREDDGGDLFNDVAEYTASETDAYVAVPATARTILSIPDFAGNHNGGMIEFGEDGYLYISTGDGGGGGDPEQTAQDLNRLLGKMLRIDVDNPSEGRAYGIPSGNPFASGGGAPEVFMYGLRNPWRWSFDAETDRIYIGDVGQGAIEEVDVIDLDDAAGADFGWSVCEGHRGYPIGQGENGCDAPAAPRHLPVYEQIRGEGGGDSNWISVIGGAVYRGTCFSGLTGRYFFSDNGASGVWSFVYADGQATDVIEHDADVPGGPSFIYPDGLGELHMGFGNGSVHRIEAE